jgi:hypothetical protein
LIDERGKFAAEVPQNKFEVPFFTILMIEKQLTFEIEVEIKVISE